MTTNMRYARLRGKSHGPNSERLLPNLPNSTAAKMATEDIIQGGVGDCCLEDKSGTPRFTPKFNIHSEFISPSTEVQSLAKEFTELELDSG